MTDGHRADVLVEPDDAMQRLVGGLNHTDALKPIERRSWSSEPDQHVLPVT